MQGTQRELIGRKLAQLEADLDHFQFLDVPRDASSAQVKTAYFSLAKQLHPDRLAILKLEDLRPQVERIFARLTDAFAALGDDARRKEYATVLAQGGTAAVKRREDDDAAKAAKILGAEEHFRLGEMALRRQAFAQAREEFAHAIELNPEEAEHHALLAWAIWCGAVDKPKAMPEVRRGLQKAIEVSNRCVPAHYYLGQVYAQIGEVEKAAAQFKKVLEESPGHMDAERELRVIRMRGGDKEKKKKK